MNKVDAKISNLRRYVKNLYTVSGQFNLYVCLCYSKKSADVARLKSEIEKIIELAAKIEREIADI